jgi:hypothetical protein
MASQGEKELTFVPIEPQDFYQKLRGLFGWNAEMLTAQERELSKERFPQGLGLHCPHCGKMRYREWKMFSYVYSGGVFFYTGKYCTCPSLSERAANILRDIAESAMNAERKRPD